MRKLKILCSLLLVILLAGCIPNPDRLDPSVPNDPESVLSAAMSALVQGDNQLPVFLGMDGKPTALSGNTGLAAVITPKVTYHVTSLQKEGDTAVATLEITAPDVVKMVYTAVEGVDTYDEAAFTEKMEQLLENAETKTYTVEVEMVKVDGQWLFVTNAAFSNAITGGLIEEYAQLRQTIIDAFTEGGEG